MADWGFFPLSSSYYGVSHHELSDIEEVQPLPVLLIYKKDWFMRTSSIPLTEACTDAIVFDRVFLAVLRKKGKDVHRMCIDIT